MSHVLKICNVHEICKCLVFIGTTLRLSVATIGKKSKELVRLMEISILMIGFRAETTIYRYLFKVTLNRPPKVLDTTFNLCSCTGHV